jgi:hypothetical protein
MQEFKDQIENCRYFRIEFGQFASFGSLEYVTNIIGDSLRLSWPDVSNGLQTYTMSINRTFDSPNRYDKIMESIKEFTCNSEQFPDFMWLIEVSILSGHYRVRR